MTDLRHRQALAYHLRGLADEATNLLTKDALQEASNYLLSGTPIPRDIADIVESALGFTQNKYGK